MKTLAIFLAPLLLLFVASGCDSKLAEITSPDQKLAWAEPAWGPPAEGLQCRLKPEKRKWLASETPAFNLDVRNHGSRIFAFFPDHQQQLCRIRFDEKWYQWPRPVMIDSPVWSLPAQSRFENIRIRLLDQFGIDITAGKHIVRAAFYFEGIEVVSNPVGIEVLPQR